MLERLLFDGKAALIFLWGCHQLIELGSAKHHPQKRHIPRQAGQGASYGVLFGE